MKDFMAWLKHITGLSIVVNFNGPTLLNFGRRGKRGKAVQLPRLLPGAAAGSMRRPLRIELGPSRRELQLARATDPLVRAGWAQTMADLRRRP